ncbi:hypothetical protein jhhlp_005031 [Lomentospora prolificans]|uniref:Cytochrome P450 n=1 Tax=Lomentospora prolificans TaxID=41688 RepID=A0A2N3N8G1_9PEZI|nr:hypothetical protein jhhlp_005031 [Lomentospora prolificans]
MVIALNDIGTPWLVAGGVATLLGYFIVKLVAHRRFYNDKPCPPHSLVWGHLKLFGENLELFPKRPYLQAALTHIKQKHNLPDVWYLDLWPVGPKFVIVTDPDASAIPTTVNAYPQSSLVSDHFSKNIGRSFIESTNGQTWKELHHVIAPGLTPAAVRSYNDIIVDEALALHNRLKAMAESGKVCENFGYEFGKFPFEVVTRIFLGRRFDTQGGNTDLYDQMHALSDAMSIISGGEKNPFTLLRAKWQERNISHKFRKDIASYVTPRFDELREKKIVPNRATAASIVDRMLAPHVEAGLPLSKAALTTIAENAFGFMAAGFGTTMDTTSYAYMLLGAFPETLAKLREEHDRLFDKSFDKTLEIIRENPSLLKVMKYTTAVIYETLRLFPIAFIIRDPPPGVEFLECNGEKYPIKDHTVGVCAHTMHLDPNIFPEPKKFNPDRFMEANPSYPRNAYRPFERGLRSCMGQTLAMDEMRIALLMTARWFDFELRDHRPSKEPKLPQSDMDTVIGVHAYQSFYITAGPSEPVKMKITLHQSS